LPAAVVKHVLDVAALAFLDSRTIDRIAHGSLLDSGLSDPGV
jgi:hypothetical protein